MLQIYRASAGSGKTFTLAYEYIKMLLGVKNPETGLYELNRTLRDRHRGILAVTFTNKATEEMKQRILHELAVLGGVEPGWSKASPYMEKLCDELHCKPEELRPAAAKALRCVLFDFNFFNVSTIDSFFQIVLRTFAREADIPGNYEVDLENKHAISYGVHELFDSLTLDGNSTPTRQIVHWITQHLLGELSRGKSVKLFDRSSGVHSGIVNFINGVSNDVFAVHYQEMMDYLSEPERLQRFVENINDKEEDILNVTRSLCRVAVRLVNERGYADGKLKVSANLMKQLSRCAEIGEETGAAKTAEKVAGDLTQAYGKPLARHLESHPDPDLDCAITDACRSIVDGASQLQLLRTSRASVFILGLLKRVYDHIERYRVENNTFLLSDTNTILREIIGDDDAPFIYERVGLWIRHFLIDEFQDTSRLQWENLRPLLREGQSSGDDSLVIGDEKQCIYRFRQSDPTLLQCEVDKESGAQQHPNNRGASTNWRSSAVVVNFNNQLFKAFSEQVGFGDVYKNVEQNISPSAKADPNRGYVKIAKVKTESSRDKKAFEEQSLQLLTEDICSQLRAGYRPSDICVLVRKNPQGTLVINHLMDVIASGREELQGVSVISDDSMPMDSAPVVKLILSVMRYMAVPPSSEDAEVAVSSKRNKKRETGKLINRYQYLMSTNTIDSNVALSMALADMVDGISDETDKIADSMACFNVPSLVERIIAQYVSPEVAAEQNMYLSAFVDVVTDFCSRGTADLQSFLSWWDETGHKSKVSAPSDEKAIRVMTIHKSKGLEFSCVHIPFADWPMINFMSEEWFITGGRLGDIESAPPMLPIRPSEYLCGTQFAAQYNQRVDEQRLDELNVTYVAFTRAVDQLCVNYPLADKNSDKNINTLLDAALEAVGLTVQQCDIDGVEIRTVGSPSRPMAEKKKSRTALQPKDSMPMAPYVTSPRDDLWGALDIEHYLDYGLARDRGIVLHDVLAHVCRDTDLEHAIELCSYRGRLPVDMVSEVLTHLRSQMARDEVKPWFAGFKRVLRERPIVLLSGEVCRPDRVVWTVQGTVDVIDYKFGEERPKAYSKQVKSYMDALESMGCDNVRGFIWYVDSGKIARV